MARKKPKKFDFKDIIFGEDAAKKIPPQEAIKKATEYAAMLTLEQKQELLQLAQPLMRLFGNSTPQRLVDTAILAEAIMDIKNSQIPILKESLPAFDKATLFSNLRKTLHPGVFLEFTNTAASFLIGNTGTSAGLN